MGPDSVEIDPLHLSITHRWKSGSAHNIHFLQNMDLGVILNRGQREGGCANSVPHDAAATLVVCLGVDGEDHDELHFMGDGKLEHDDVLAQAIEVLISCRRAAEQFRGTSPRASRRHGVRAALATLATLVALVALVVIAQPAHAEDRRPCVSKVEYQSTPGAIKVLRGAVDMPALSRRGLEERWDVRGLGVIDPEYSDDQITMWIYPACGYSIDEAYVMGMSTGRNGVIDVIGRWVAPGATPHGRR